MNREELAFATFTAFADVEVRAARVIENHLYLATPVESSVAELTDMSMDAMRTGDVGSIETTRGERQKREHKPRQPSKAERYAARPRAARMTRCLDCADVAFTNGACINCGSTARVTR